MQDVTFVNAITGDERMFQMRIPSCLAASELKQQNSVNWADAYKVQPLSGWSGLSSLLCGVFASKLHMTWYFLWRTRCGIATAIRRNDISKLCCDAVKLQPWRQGPLRLVPLEQAGLPPTNSLRHQTWSCLPIPWYWCFRFFPSLPVTASASWPRCFVLLSHLWATAFEISGPAGPAQWGAAAGKPEARVIAVYRFESF